MASFTEIHTRDVRGGATAASGVPRALVVLSAACAIWSLTYVVPGLEAYRPWDGEGEAPFVRLLRPTTTGPIVAEAGGGTSSLRSLSAEERRLLSFAATKEKHKPLRAGPGLVARKAGAPAISIPGSVTADVKVHIEDPGGAMKPFYEALGRTARRRPGAVTRISQWGDSATAPDKITAVTRVLLQKRFGDAGRGFILAARGTKWYRNAGVIFQHRNWKVRRITHLNARDRKYGYGGVRAMGRRGASSSYALLQRGTIGRSVGRFDVYFLKGPGQGELSLKVDRGEEQRISAQADAWEDAVHTVKVPDGKHRLSLRVARGKVSVFGTVLEREVPGVVFDNLGLVGYIATRMLKQDAAHFKSQLDLRKPDLMIVMFGGNYLAMPFWRPVRYERGFTDVLKRFRTARPQSSCLVIAPLDHGEKVGGKVRTVPKLLKMIAIQRRAALASGCAFYNVFDAMGGKGTMGRWAATKPRLVLHDFAHVTRHGARIIGSLLYKALVAGFVGHLGGGVKKASGSSSPGAG